VNPKEYYSRTQTGGKTGDDPDGIAAQVYGMELDQAVGKERRQQKKSDPERQT
jgi:hypothetical protein